MKTTMFLAAAAAIAFASPAAAQDAPHNDGFYAGIVTGYDHASISDGVDRYNSDGVIYGVTTGFDWVAGNMLFGLEGEYADSTAGTSETDVLTAGDKVSLDAVGDLYVGGRVGYAMGNGGALYVKGGYTQGRVKLSYDDGVDTYSESDNLGGWRVGAGYEMAFGKKMFGRLEYRYSDYGEWQPDNFSTGLTTDRHQVALVIGAKF